MSEIAEFILAQYTRIEAVARASSPWPWHLNTEGDEVVAVDDVTAAEVFALSGRQQRATAEHIVINDPDYVLADIASKRRIVERERWHPHGGLECGGHPGPYMPHGDYGPGYCRRIDEENQTLLDLAAPFSAEPGYKQEWSV